MAGRRFSLIAKEGTPFLLSCIVGLLLIVRIELWWALPLLLTVMLLLFLLFRDPDRDIPAAPLAVVSPVDGEIIDIAPTDKGVLEGEAQRIIIKVHSLGAYTARSPIEGRVLDLRDNMGEGSRLLDVSGLWVRTDEGDDVVLLFRGPRWIAAPVAFLGYGERVGQGQRCAYLRLARFAEVHLPISSKIKVAVGQRVAAGSDTLAKLRHH